MKRLRQFVCGLTGHHNLLHFEDGRVMMRCSNCGHDSPGWSTNDQRPRPRYAGDATRHRLNRPLLVRSTSTNVRTTSTQTHDRRSTRNDDRKAIGSF